MKNIRIGFIGRIVIAIAAGIGFGCITPMWGARICATFNDIFSQFLGFVIPLIIIGFVAPAIADIGKQAGKMLLATVLIAYFATLISGFASYITGEALFPQMLASDEVRQTLSASEAQEIAPYFTVGMPPIMPVMTALVFAFMAGLGIAFADGTALRRGFGELREIVARTIERVIVPLLPIYIFGIFVNMTVAGQVAPVLGAFIKIIVVIFALHIGILLLQYCIAACFSGRNPLTMLRTMMPAYLTALGTSSSAATIPVTLAQAVKMGVRQNVAGFVIPLCATIHMSGSMLKMVACSLAIMIMDGMPYDMGLYTHFIALLGITIVAAPGITGGVMMASLGVLSSVLGFNDAQCGLMIALYIAMDSFGTACNVTGDGAIATVIDRLFRKKSVPGCDFSVPEATN